MTAKRASLTQQRQRHTTALHIAVVLVATVPTAESRKMNKLGKVAGVRIACAAVFNSGTVLAGLGYGGVSLMRAVGASADTDTSVISIIVLVLFAILSGWVMLLGLVDMAHAGTDKLREEERMQEIRRQESKRGATRV